MRNRLNHQEQSDKISESDIVSRFREAIITIRKLPPVRVQGYFNAWSEIVYSKAEIRHMDKKSKIWPPTTEAISRMEEAMNWLSLIKDVKNRKIILMRANNIPWEIICKNFAMCRATAHKRWKSSINLIANNCL